MPGSPINKKTLTGLTTGKGYNYKSPFFSSYQMPPKL